MPEQDPVVAEDLKLVGRMKGEASGAQSLRRKLLTETKKFGNTESTKKGKEAASKSGIQLEIQALRK